ncbi:amino acid permease [Flavobacterium covae]|uniref:DUF3810 domain-containing protein n=1 Tax=Flavobacterium TaxID=237 RepID=UPI0007C1ED86|nr:DUF3810 domain-containing protein [Flavobacterium covae]AND65033.1 amino acid permease [Flavobacterium covae]
MKPLKINNLKISKNILFFIFFVFQILLLKIFSKFPTIVEQYYSNGFYLMISKLNRIIFGWIPFSIGDCIYILTLIYLPYWLYKNRKICWKENTKNLFSFLVTMYFIFHLLWAYNYYRIPLYKKMNLKTDYSQKELLQFTQNLIHKTNKIQFKLTRNINQKVISPYTAVQIFELAQSGYINLKNRHSFFEYKKTSIKNSLFSYPLTYMGFGGYLNPFTNEAQINNMLPSYNLPAIVCHEMAHQIGYSSESECNFIGFLATIHNQNLFFQYAGYTYALRYCLVNIESKDQKELKRILQTINPGILKNFDESNFFWSSHESIINEGFEIFYDYFLKLNQQKEGMKSYSKFIDLLINYQEN